MIVGKVGDDTLNGGDGNDRLFGNSGSDRLNGGHGNDVMTGQQGIDIYEFDMAPGRDSITDFTTGESKEVYVEEVTLQRMTAPSSSRPRATCGPGRARSRPRWKARLTPAST